MVKRAVVMLAIVGLLLLLVHSAVQDRDIDFEALKLGLGSEPEMSVENLKLEREVNGATWYAAVPRVERRGSVVTAVSVDVRRTAGSGEWLLSVDRALYSENSEVVTAYDVKGVSTTEGYSFVIDVPEASWSLSDDAVVVPRGFELKSGVFDLSGERGTFERGTLITVERGKVTWYGGSF